MRSFVLYHRHPPANCATAFAAWNGFHSPLRGGKALSTCGSGGHEIWWVVSASDDRSALRLLPGYLADRAVAIAVAEVEIP